jgi:RimJ/RimL family protein N-acetyltransferase
MTTFDSEEPEFAFQPMDEVSARAIHTWRHESPYDIYNANPEAADAFAEALLDPRFAYYAITSPRDDLVGYCCFGLDARVPGGNYVADALDVGLGMRPDLTGQGRGPGFFAAILDFARQTFAPRAFRLTVATFNQRALKVYERAGFRVVQAFRRSTDGLAFSVLMREE